VSANLTDEPGMGVSGSLSPHATDSACADGASARQNIGTTARSHGIDLDRLTYVPVFPIALRLVTRMTCSRLDFLVLQLAY